MKGPSNQSAAKTIPKFAGYKSEWVSERIISVSTNENDLVYIPFAGTGTECVSCTRLNRKFIASEIDLERFNISKNRIESIYSILNDTTLQSNSVSKFFE